MTCDLQKKPAIFTMFMQLIGMLLLGSVVIYMK